jgi:NADPH:quinone reductase-like Zn-dependent oxidoreductase
VNSVFGVTNRRFVGAQAEYAVAEIRSLARQPSAMDFVDAAAMPDVAVTAWSMLFEHGALGLGQRDLNHGAAGRIVLVTAGDKRQP